jgi:hypothetical protein
MKQIKGSRIKETCIRITVTTFDLWILTILSLLVGGLIVFVIMKSI